MAHILTRHLLAHFILTPETDPPGSSTPLKIIFQCLQIACASFSRQCENLTALLIKGIGWSVLAPSKREEVNLHPQVGLSLESFLSNYAERREDHLIMGANRSHPAHSNRKTHTDSAVQLKQVLVHKLSLINSKDSVVILLN